MQVRPVVGDHGSGHDERVAALDQGVGRHVRAEERLPRRGHGRPEARERRRVRWLPHACAKANWAWLIACSDATAETSAPGCARAESTTIEIEARTPTMAMHDQQLDEREAFVSARAPGLALTRIGSDSNDIRASAGEPDERRRGMPALAGIPLGRVDRDANAIESACRAVAVRSAERRGRVEEDRAGRRRVANAADARLPRTAELRSRSNRYAVACVVAVVRTRRRAARVARDDIAALHRGSPRPRSGEMNPWCWAAQPCPGSTSVVA